MRPASIISLIIAVLLVILGLTTCIIAQNMANANGESLFPEIKTDGLTSGLDLSEVDFSKVELLVSDAVIHIIGNSPSSRIECTNFRENYYNLTTANKVLSFDEIPDVISMLKFWENGFSFKGMRYLFNFQPETEGTKEIKIYIGPDTDVKIFDIVGENCTVYLEKLSSNSDYNIEIQTGSVNVVDTLRTTSAFTVTGKDLTVDLKKAMLMNVDIKADNLNLTSTAIRINGTTEIECLTGDIRISTPVDLASLPLDVTSVTGTLSLNGQEVILPFQQENPSAPNKSITIHTDSANISLSQNSSGNSETEQ